MTIIHHTTILTLLASLAVPGTVTAVELRLQLGTTPGYDTISEEATDLDGADYTTPERSLSAERGLSLGLQYIWVKSEGVSFLRGLEVSYRTDAGNDVETSQIGIGGRMGVGWVITPGVRLEAGARAMIGYAQTDDARDSADGGLYPGNTIVAEEHQSASGLGYQFGAFFGLNYTFQQRFLIGVELGYEYTGAVLSTDYLVTSVSGAGATCALNAGYSF